VVVYRLLPWMRWFYTL